MKRTGRTLVILTLAAWLAALTPALAAPSPVGDDPVRIGIGIGGDIIDVLSHDEDNGDEEGNGDEDGDEDGDGLLGLVLGNGDDGDENGDGVLEELVNVVDKVVEVLFGEEEDSVDSPTGISVSAARLADDDGLVGRLLEVLEELEFEDLEPLEDVLDPVEDTVEFVVVTVGQNQVVATICQLRHFIATGSTFSYGLGSVFIPPIGPMPTCTP